MLESAGVLLFRRMPSGIEVLIVHPSGNYNRRAPWSIPKGLIDPGESAEAAARRETFEETGLEAGALVSLGEVRYTKSRKRIRAFAAEVAADVVARCASWEIDAAEFVSLDEARGRLHPDQKVLVDRLIQALGES
jgi:predicted NUDIX family NTP pyrophosphohydrolase